MTSTISRKVVEKRLNLTRLTAYFFIGLAIAIGIVTRLVSLLRYTTFDIGPSPDQIRDAVVYMDMLKGNFPTLGQPSSIGDYNLPPLYYYLVLPAVWLGADPSFQVLPNGLFSVLAIGLFIVLIYELLENSPKESRLFLAGLGGFWYSLIFSEVFVSTFEWNVSPIPFFLFSFLLLYKRQLAGQASLPMQTLQWLLYGISLAVLVCLHSTTLFVMPIVFLGSTIVFLVRYRKQPQRWFLPGVAIASALIALTPYWIGEIARKGSNTKKILALIFSHSGDQTKPLELFYRISRMVFNYLELGQQAFFTKFSWFYSSFGILFLLLVLVLGIARFKGNRTLLGMLLALWLIYLYAASTYAGDYIFHYKMLIFFAPILFTLLTLAYVQDASQWASRAIASFVILGITLSSLSNLYFNYQYLDSKFGQHRMIAIPDVTAILKQLPVGATICDPQYIRWRQKYHVVQYLDTYVTQKNIQLSADCQAGHYLIYPTFRYVFLDNNRWPQFQIVRTKPFNKDALVALDTPVARVYQMNQPYSLNKCYSSVSEPNKLCLCPTLAPCL